MLRVLIVETVVRAIEVAIRVKTRKMRVTDRPK